MKITPVLSRLATALLVGLMPAQVFAGGAVTTGTVTAVAKETGAVTVLSDQTRGPIQYTGLEKTVVQFGSGKVATLADVAVGQYVTVEYTMSGKTLVVARFLIPDPKPAMAPSNPAAFTAGERSGLGSKAARDGDITTQPGSKARTDNDITTKPGKKDAADPDITKKSGK